MYVFPNDLGQAFLGKDIVPLRSVLPFSRFVFESFIGGQAEFGQGSTTRGIFHFGIFPDVTNQNDFVHALGH